MAKIILLDAGPLGMVTHPRANKENRFIVQWLKTRLATGAKVFVPEIADYEVRRELLRANKTVGIERLDALKEAIGYLPINTRAMLLAAELWAQARNAGYPTASDKALDADVILAAQARTLHNADDDPIIATTNVGHLERFANAQQWQNIN